MLLEYVSLWVLFPVVKWLLTFIFLICKMRIMVTFFAAQESGFEDQLGYCI